MRYLQKLPLLLALAAAFFTGLMGFMRQGSQKEILNQMVLLMILFFALGLFVRATLLNAKEQVELKVKEREREELRKQQELELEKSEKEAATVGKNIDFTAGKVGEDAFEPLPVSEFIKKELKRG